ncbi:MAG: choloylglycine hydrolase family protein [Desulfobacteraceae bacterium]|nr:MAG: choloylglycine hydrolase family protein [Desulfobacteraceae bacterium]
MQVSKLMSALVGALLLFSINTTTVNACTGIRLSAEDGSTVYGRTMEWGTFDLNSRVAIIPRGYAFAGLTPDGHNGKKWEAKYGVVGLDMLGKDIFADGMNEKGLAAGIFYHPGFASYMKYDKAQPNNTITAVDIVSYILSQFSTIDEVKSGMKSVRVVPVVEEALGIPVQAHWMVTESSGKSIVIEYLNNELYIFDNPLGVITNAPSYDWHMTNLRNYVNLSAVALPSKKLEDIDFAPLGGGSGMIGLPGDFTPPSRFVRAVAWSQTARPLKKSDEAIYELFRILDNFNVPLGAAEGSDREETNLKGMRSSTIWTTGWDLSNKVFYFHTQHNRRVRKVDLDKIDFSKKEIFHIPLDDKKEQDIKDITPANR